MGEIIEFQVTGGYQPPETAEDEIPSCLRAELRENGRLEQYLERKLRASNASLANGHQRRMQLEIRSLEQENAALREQVTQSQAIAHQLSLELARLRVLLREYGVEL